MSLVDNGSALLPYDRHVGRYSPALAARLIDAVGVRSGWRALDVGCGTGALTAALTRLLGAGRVAAVDPSPSAVEVCSERVPVADVRLASAERLPFGADRFDAVLSQLVIDKVDGPRAVAEMRRVARPGSVIAAAVWDFEQGMTLLRAYWDAALVVDRPGAVAAAAGVSPPNSRPAELRRLWSDAGLVSVEVRELLVAADYDDLDDAWAPFVAGSGISGRYCRSLEPRAREALKREFARALGSPAGRFRLQARAWYVVGTAP
jgi:SAM-dependent methyltransferase